MFEMLVFLFGVYAFVFGSVKLPWSMSLDGWRARIAGVLLMLPLPVLILLGLGVDQGVDRDSAMSFYGIMELVVTLLGILGAVLVAYLSREKTDEGSP